MNIEDRYISERDLQMVEFVIKLNSSVLDVRLECNGTRIEALVIPSVTAKEMKQHRFPNDLEVFYLSEGEPEFFYDDIFINKCYFDDCIKLNEGDLIFDVGANVGYFSLAIAQSIKDFCVFSFEPAPATFDALVMNSILHKWPVKLFNCGLSNREGYFDFTYYPNGSGYSTFLGSTEQEKDLLRSIIVDKIRETGEEGLLTQIDSLCDYKLKAEQHKCKLMPISEIIALNGVKRIDLLKIDAEKSEMDIYSGIGEKNFDIIKQLVIEVHDFSSQADSIQVDLETKGFKVFVKRSQTTVMTSIYATRNLPDQMPLRSKFDTSRPTYEYNSNLTKFEEQLTHDIKKALSASLFPFSVRLVSHF